MRFVWALIVACLVAATGVRPEIETRSLDEAASPLGRTQLERPPATLPQLAARYAAPQLHASRPDGRTDHGLPVATAASRFAFSAQPLRISLVETAAPAALVVTALASARSARGPPSTSNARV